MLPAPPGGVGDLLLCQPRPGAGESKIDAGSESSHRVTLHGMTGVLLPTPVKLVLGESLALHADITGVLHFTQGQYQLD
jgi:hypothetical protein